MWMNKDLTYLNLKIIINSGSQLKEGSVASKLITPITGEYEGHILLSTRAPQKLDLHYLPTSHGTNLGASRRA